MQSLPGGASRSRNVIVQCHDIGNTVWISIVLKSHLVITNNNTVDGVDDFLNSEHPFLFASRFAPENIVNVAGINTTIFHYFRWVLRFDVLTVAD